MGRRGPKPKATAEKMNVLSIRLRPDVRAKLDKARVGSGRSLGGEIQHRVIQTFGDEEKTADLFGSVRTRRVMQMLALALQNVQGPERPDLEWLDDPWTFMRAQAAFEAVLESIRPTARGNYLLEDAKLQLINQHMQLAKAQGTAVIKSLREADPSLPKGATHKQHLTNLIRADLGKNLNLEAETWDPNEIEEAEAMLKAMEERDWSEARRLVRRVSKRHLSERKQHWWEFASLQIPKKGSKK